jgi:flavin-dependent dehydrogenase
LDVVVLGAGPAGSTAARLLSQWGHEIVLITRSPARRSLAESLPPSCSKLLDRVGARAAVDAAGFVRASGNTVRWGESDERVELFGTGELGYQVARDRFDALLLDEAVRAGACVIHGVAGRVRPASGDGPTATVAFATREGPQSLRAPWILDCRGQSAPRASPKESVRTVALVGVWESERWQLADSTHTLVESYRSGWAWSVPETEQRRFVTVMVDPAVTRLGGRSIGRQYREQLAQTDWIGPMCARVARPIGRVWARDATQHCASEIAAGGVLRVGDAASFVDPLSSFGVKKALASAWLAAVTVHTALVDPKMAASAAAFYEARERAMYETLARTSAALAGPAGKRHESPFWDARASDGLEAAPPPAGAAAARASRARAALGELKARERIALEPGTGVTREARPVVTGNRIALLEHLVSPEFPEGVRYLRNVDVVRLAELAAAHDEVGELYAAYASAAAPVPLPDFLGALSTLIGSELLTLG